jgi:hypothetical protein
MEGGKEASTDGRTERRTERRTEGRTERRTDGRKEGLVADNTAAGKERSNGRISRKEGEQYTSFLPSFLY